MYTVTQALGVKFGIHKTWAPVDVSAIAIKDLFVTYRRLQLTVLPTSNAAPEYMDFEVLREATAGFSGTLAMYFATLGEQVLPTESVGLSVRTRTAKYRDAFQAGYTVTPVNRANNAAGHPSDVDKTAVRLTRESPVTDYAAFHRTCLVSINGFYHLTDTDGASGVVVYEAMTSLRQAKQNQIGLLSFNTVAPFEVVRITEPMVHQLQRARPVVTLPMDLTNKTVMLVLGGYLHAVDPAVFQRVGASSYRINLDALPLLERYFESRRYLDLSSLPVDTSPTNDAQTTLASLTSNATTLAYLLLSQTFFVVLDCPEIYTQRQYVKRTGLPDMYIAYQKPTGPLVAELGRHPEYWQVHEDAQYSITVYDNVVGNHLFNTVLPATLHSLDDANVPTRAKHISAAYFLEIGRDV